MSRFLFQGKEVNVQSYISIWASIRPASSSLIESSRTINCLSISLGKFSHRLRDEQIPQSEHHAESLSRAQHQLRTEQ